MGMLIQTLFWFEHFSKPCHLARKQIGLLYNCSSARQNQLKIKRLILSRRSASSESSPFVKAILKVEFRELYFTPPQDSMPRRYVLWAESLVLWAELCHKRN